MFLLIIVVSAFSCDFFDDNTDCSENSEDSYVESSLVDSPRSPYPVHSSASLQLEFCEPKYYNCSCTNMDWANAFCRNCRIVNGSNICDCDYYEEANCNGCVTVFKENCARSEYVDETGRLCGKYPYQNYQPCNPAANTCIHTDGYAGFSQFMINEFAQCFVAKYLDENGGNPNDMTPYFPLPYPSRLEINGYLCTGAPEDVVYYYDVNGISIVVDFQYADDCVACQMPLKINGVAYDLRNDPDCGRDVPDSGFLSSYCDAKLSRANETS